MNIKPLLLAVSAALSFAAPAAQAAQAVNSLNLGSYAVSASYGLDLETSTGVSGLEASAVTYARDRGTLFFVGDEGTGVIEISLTGQTLGSMAFDWSATGSSKHDTEGLTYLGNGQLVVSEERLQDAYLFTYSAGATARLAGNSVSMSNSTVGNSGIEGISYDARNGGSFVTVKQENPIAVNSGTLSFGASASGSSTMSALFSEKVLASLGLTTLSDVQTLSSVDSFAGTAAADHLLLLSLGSKKLVEVDRNGQLLGSFDLSGVLADNAIEGVTIDEKGTIYLVAEQLQTSGAPDGVKSQLIVLTPVPEPETYAMLLAGLAMLGGVARRRRGTGA